MYGIIYTTSRSGRVPKFVECEACGHEYGYWMERTAAGSGTSYFLIGRGAAQERAGRGARALLEKRLREECDPVPCPECGRYQKAMIAPARDERFAWIFKASLVAGAVAVVATIPIGFVLRLVFLRLPRLQHLGMVVSGLLCPAALLVPLAGYALKLALANRFHPNKDVPVDERIERGRERAMSRKEHERLLREERKESRSDPYESKRRWEDE